MQPIRWSPVLSALTDAEIRRLTAASSVRSIDRGAYLSVAGEQPASVHLLEEGIAKLVAADERGAEAIVGLAVPGDLVGHLAAVVGSNHDTDAHTLIPARVMTFDAATFARVVTENHAASLELARDATRHVRALTKIHLDRLAAPVAERLAGSLLNLAEMLGTRRGSTIDLHLPLNQTDLGNLVGTSRETTCKTMRKWRTGGVVDYRGRRLRILRPDLLERVRCGGL